MMPDPARSRVERRWRLAGRARGFSVIEQLVVLCLLTTVTAIGVPMVLASLDGARVQGAARYLSGRLNLARMEAVKRSVYVAIKVEASEDRYRCTFYADGNSNGVLTVDIDRQIDKPIRPQESLEEQFPGVVFGIVDGVTAIDGSDPLDPADPIRFGRGDLVSFSPIGTATAGTFYLRGRGQQQMAVRVLGTTGRVRVLRFDFRMHKWLSQ